MIHSNRQSTLNGIQLNFDRHIKSYIGEIRLRDLTVSDLQWLYNHLGESGRVDKKGGLSGATIRRIHNIVHQALKQAVAEDIIIKNVSDQVVLKKSKSREYKPYTASEIQTLLDATKDDFLYPAIALLVFSGIRRSELLALSFDDLSFEDRTISISKALTLQATTDEPSRYKIMPTKSEKSNRVVPMAEPLVSILKERQRHLKELRLQSGNPDFNTQNLICTDENGEIINGNLFTQRFKALLKKYNLRDIRVHDLRHSFATEQLRSAANVENVRDMLGHSNIQMILTIYRHVSMEEKRYDIDRFTEHLRLKASHK